MNKYSKELASKYTQGRDKYSGTDAKLFELIQQVGVKDKDVLDLGCGDGRYAAKFLEMGAKSAEGIDISPAMIELAQERHGNIEFTIGDCENMPYKDESFDMIFSNFVLHYCEDIQKAFSEITRTLKKGGYFIGIFNSIEIDNHNILHKQMPVLLGEDDPVTVHNLMRLDGEYQDTIKSSGLNIVEFIDEPNSYAFVDPNFEYYSDIKKLKNMIFLCRK